MRLQFAGYQPKRFIHLNLVHPSVISEARHCHLCPTAEQTTGLMLNRKATLFFLKATTSSTFYGFLFFFLI